MPLTELPTDNTARSKACEAKGGCSWLTGTRDGPFSHCKASRWHLDENPWRKQDHLDPIVVIRPRQTPTQTDETDADATVFITSTAAGLATVTATRSIPTSSPSSSSPSSSSTSSLESLSSRSSSSPSWSSPTRTTTKTTTRTTTTTETSSSTLGTTVPSPPTISPPPSSDHDHPTAAANPSSNGMTISVSALVGIVISCAIVVIFAALVLCMWWGRRRRQRKEKQRIHDDPSRVTYSRGGEGEGGESGWGGRTLSSRSGADELLPPGMESVFNPMTQNGPGSVFDRTEGRMAEADSMVSLSQTPRQNPRQGIAASNGENIIPSTKTLTLGEPWAASGSPSCGPPLSLGSSSPELDSKPIQATKVEAKIEAETGAASGSGLGGSEGSQLGFRGCTGRVDILDATPRATLNSTEQERKAGTYANSWTRFQNVQL